MISRIQSYLDGVLGATDGLIALFAIHKLNLTTTAGYRDIDTVLKKHRPILPGVPLSTFFYGALLLSFLRRVVAVIP